MRRRTVLVIVLLAFMMTLLPVKAEAAHLRSAAKSMPGVFQNFISDPRWSHGTVWNGNQRPKVSHSSDRGCCAYCADFTKYCFGFDYPNEGEAFYDTSEIRAGDVILVGTMEEGEGHWFICLERDGNYLYTADANVYFSDNYRVRVGWNYYIMGGTRISGTKFPFTAGYHYLPLNYTVTYDANGGENAPAPQTKAGGKGIILSSVVPTRASTVEDSFTVTLDANGGSVSLAPLSASIIRSYSFIEWNTAANGVGTSYAPADCYVDDADVTLYAQWSSSIAVEAVTLPTLTREGWTFLGWAESPNAVRGVTGSYTPTGNVTLYALWESNSFTVSYNANGGKNAPKAQTKIAGEPLRLSSVKPTRASKSVGSYTVTLNTNGGIFKDLLQTDCRVAFKTAFKVVQASHETRILTVSAQRRLEYSFSGWNTAANGSGTRYVPGGLYETDADVTLYAQWNSGIVTKPVNLPIPEREGWKFLGWAEKPDAEKGVMGSYTPSGDITLYAIWWYDGIMVSYDANGGDYAPKPQAKKPGEPLYLSKEEPKREAKLEGIVTVTLDANGGKCMTERVEAKSWREFRFACWNTEADGCGEKFAPGDVFKYDKPLTLYAIWDSHTFNDSVDLPTPEREGWVFLGWAEKPDAESGVTGKYRPTGDITLYAIWEETKKEAADGVGDGEELVQNDSACSIPEEQISKDETEQIESEIVSIP